ncbi:MAG: helix-turn-helix domain-containing protein [Planctomycetaceae bacterium]|nr:helix-turn-helix domain-containing protein [Planctomycetaceae bacterium]MCA9046152.1 helix-turn-helix domain-containing protein [Planctomycetaceae bacterium]
MNNLQDYMTIKDAAEYLGVTPNTLRNWGRDGKIEERRNPLNGYRLYKKTELDRLLKKIERSRNAE